MKKHKWHLKYPHTHIYYCEKCGITLSARNKEDAGRWAGDCE